jgi:hypothetical protein
LVADGGKVVLAARDQEELKLTLISTLAPIKDFNPLLQMASGVCLTLFGGFVFGTPGLPLSDVPLLLSVPRGVQDRQAWINNVRQKHVACRQNQLRRHDRHDLHRPPPPRGIMTLCAAASPPSPPRFRCWFAW